MLVGHITLLTLSDRFPSKKRCFGSNGQISTWAVLGSIYYTTNATSLARKRYCSTYDFRIQTMEKRGGIARPSKDEHLLAPFTKRDRSYLFMPRSCPIHDQRTPTRWLRRRRRSVSEAKDIVVAESKRVLEMAMARTKFNKAREGPKYLLPVSLCVNSYLTSFAHLRMDSFPENDVTMVFCCHGSVMSTGVPWESVSLRRPYNSLRVEQVATALGF